MTVARAMSERCRGNIPLKFVCYVVSEVGVFRSVHQASQQPSSQKKILPEERTPCQRAAGVRAHTGGGILDAGAALTRCRERERETDLYFGSSAAPLLGGLCRSLASGGSWGVNLDCASRGAFPVAPAVLESHIGRHCA